MRFYDDNTTSDILARLESYSGKKVDEEMQKLKKQIGANLYNDFKKELFSRLNSYDYDSELVVGDSLQDAGNQFFKGVNYQIRRNMERDSNTMSKAALKRKYTGRGYKTADDATIKKYADFLYALNKINFFMEE